jgi:hypothetical protein
MCTKSSIQHAPNAICKGHPSSVVGIVILHVSLFLSLNTYMDSVGELLNYAAMTLAKEDWRGISSCFSAK